MCCFLAPPSPKKPVPPFALRSRLYLRIAFASLISRILPDLKISKSVDRCDIIRFYPSDLRRSFPARVPLIFASQPCTCLCEKLDRLRCDAPELSTYCRCLRTTSPRAVRVEILVATSFCALGGVCTQFSTYRGPFDLHYVLRGGK